LPEPRQGDHGLLVAGEGSRTDQQIVNLKTGRAEIQRPQAEEQSWKSSSQPAWLTNEFYETKIQPLLGNIPRSAISTALGVSKTYASEIRTGKSLPHPRHWQKLAELVGLSAKS
jgi:hypothetical protein